MSVYPPESNTSLFYETVHILGSGKPGDSVELRGFSRQLARGTVATLPTLLFLLSVSALNFSLRFALMDPKCRINRKEGELKQNTKNKTATKSLEISFVRLV